MIMIPALGFFYGGLVKRKNVISTIAQCFAIFAIVSIIWWLYGYGLTFGPSIDGVIGIPSIFGLFNNGFAPNPNYSSNIPELLYFTFQLMFAAITPALIIGAIAGRVRFKALIIFVILWSTFIYFPIAHWIWNAGGWLKALGVIDFAGGLVVHISAGFSALAAALVIGSRRGVNSCTGDVRPNNIPYVLIGAALLWFGWFGFNGGSALAANMVAVSALVNTNMSAAAAAVSWMFLDWHRKGKPSATGIAIGAVCGMVAITPASGYVGISAAVIIGLVVGLLSNIVSNWRACRTRVDDSLDVFACHGVGSMWGVLATGIFASTAINAAGPNGLVFGNPSLLLVQAFAIMVVAAFAFVGSYILLKIVNKFTPLRVSPEEEEAGLDKGEMGEEAYS